MSGRLILALVAMLLLSVTSHCYHNRVTLNPEGTPGEYGEIGTNFFLWGLAPGTKRYSSEELCGDKGLYQVHHYTTFLDGIFNLFTIGIYSPRTLEYTCNGEAALKFRLVPQGDQYAVYANRPAREGEINRIAW